MVANAVSSILQMVRQCQPAFAILRNVRAAYDAAEK
jgi:hypothetical protein